MPPVTLAAVVDLTKIKMKWKEQYVSEGLNRKVIPSMPKGIYSGLRLIQNISSPRQVEVSASPDVSHAAVHQSVTGFSTTYHDNAGGSTILSLVHADLDNQETVIALSIVYTIGADTTASWIAYPIADWNALTDAQRAERIVLGTVNVPAPATNITTAMILPTRRTVAWENEASGAVAWSPVVKNPSFEHGTTGGFTKYSLSDWEAPTTTWSIGHVFQIGTTTVRSGAKSLELNKGSLGAGNCSIEQFQEIPVVPGQLINVTGWVRQLIAPTAGSYTFDLYWGDLDSIATTVTSVTASVLTAVDAGFRRVSQVVAVPVATYVLKKVRIQVSGVVTASTGIALVVDDFQVYVESGSPQAIAAAANSRLKQQLVSALVVETSDTYSLGQLAALLRFDKTTPASEGQLVIERRDQVGTSLPPALSLPGRVVNLGNNLLGSEANALRARITAPVSVAGSVDFTLMWESVPSGQPGHRRYVSATGQLVETVNAVWGGASWSKDLAGVRATMFILDRGFIEQYGRDADASWSVWTKMSKMSIPHTVTAAEPVFNPMLELFDFDGNRHVAFDHNGFENSRVRRYTIDWNTVSPAIGNTGSGFDSASYAAYLDGPGAQLGVQVNNDTTFFEGAYQFATPLHASAISVLEWEVSGAALAGTPPLTMEMGWKHDQALPSTEDYVKFAKTSASANWQFMTRSTALTFTADTGVAAGGVQRFRIEWYGNSHPGGDRVLAFINGVLVAENADATRLPDSDPMPVSVIFKATGASGIVTVTVSPFVHNYRRILSDDAV